MNINLLLFTLLGAVGSCVAYSSGAPDDACFSLMPGHTGTTPQQGSSPYIVSAEKMEAKKVRVTISSPDGKAFKGFILQARSANDKEKFIVGEFKTDAKSQGISCDGHEKSALTHVNKELKTEVITEWTGTYDEDVIFRATVVKSFHEYWTNIDSDPVKIGEKEQVEDEVTNTEELSKDSVYKGCFEWKGCLGIPNKCVEENKCVVLFTYQNNTDGSVQFALHGLLNVSEYMAMGLSDDSKMGDDAVTGCLREGSNAKLQKSWNVAEKYNTLPTDVTEPYDSNIVNGLTTCAWKEPSVMSFNGRSYDFAHDKIHILLALGPVTKSGGLSYHRATLATTEPVNFSGHEHVDHTVHVVSEDQNKPSKEKPGKQPEKKDEVAPNCCSQLNFGLFWLAFFAVSYAGGRNALNLV